MDISSAALRKLRAELELREQGVLDEMGLGALHVGYADAFFPGTSVLHTRARYLFFVPWMYLRLASKGADEVARYKLQAEKWLTGRLLEQEDKTGIIGGRVYPRPPAQPPDFAYWSALRRFGMYEGPRRAQLLARWERHCVVRQQDARQGDEDVGVGPLGSFYVPPAPAWWRKRDAEVTFTLTPEEAVFLQERLSALTPSCLLGEAAARLTPQRGPTGNHIWKDVFLREATEALDARREHTAAGPPSVRDALGRTRGVSALAALIRTMYAAMVEALREQDLRERGHSLPDDVSYYRETLVGYWRDNADSLEDARALSLHDVSADLGPGMPLKLRQLLAHVQRKLRTVRTGRDVLGHLCEGDMRARFTTFEQARKGARARLPKHAGRPQREGFTSETLPTGGLHYRWGVVWRLLDDLRQGLSHD